MTWLFLVLFAPAPFWSGVRICDLEIYLDRLDLKAGTNDTLMISNCSCVVRSSSNQMRSDVVQDLVWARCSWCGSLHRRS